MTSNRHSVPSVLVSQACVRHRVLHCGIPRTISRVMLQMRRDTKIIIITIFVHCGTYTYLHTLVTGKFENNSIMLSVAHFKH